MLLWGENCYCLGGKFKTLGEKFPPYIKALKKTTTGDHFYLFLMPYSTLVRSFLSSSTLRLKSAYLKLMVT